MIEIVLRLLQELRKLGRGTCAIHGDKEQWEREQALLAHIGTNPEWIDPQCEVHRKKAIKVMQARHGQGESEG